MVNSVLFSSKSDEWRTPKELFYFLNNEFGFDLDAAASSSNALCKHYFDKYSDGLLSSWSGHKVFCNPPYSQIKKWVKKAYDSRTVCSVIVLLIPARTDTSWFHEYIYNKAEIRFLRGRVHFSDSPNGAPFPSMLVIYRSLLWK